MGTAKVKINFNFKSNVNTTIIQIFLISMAND